MRRKRRRRVRIRKNGEGRLKLAMAGWLLVLSLFSNLWSWRRKEFALGGDLLSLGLCQIDNVVFVPTFVFFFIINKKKWLY